MPKWLVVSPEYSTTVPILDYGQGPTEYGCDVLEVEAPTRRQAIITAVKAWRKQPRGIRYCWHDENPFTGVRAERVEEDEPYEA